MCGIVAALGDEATVETVRAMTKLISHRGDPGSITAIPVSGECVMGFTRLAIVNPADGEQPYLIDDVCSTVNGEIWNHLDLRNKQQRVKGF